MLIKFFARGRGGGRGPVQYVTRPTNPVTREPREPSPEVLAGDPTRTWQLIDGLSFKLKYTSGVIAWSAEDKPSEEQQRTVMADFERTAFAGLDRERYDILWVRHTHTGSTELHFVVPRVDLGTGKSLNIAPPGWERTFAPLRDAWNFEQGWARPDDPERARLLQPGHRALVEFQNLRQGLQQEAEPKTLITEYLTQRIEAGAVADRAGIVAALEETGLQINRQGRDYVSVRDPDTGSKYRLKGAIYAESFQRDELARAAASQDRDGPKRDRGVDLDRAASARRELEQAIKRRAAFHRERYRLRGGERTATADMPDRHPREVSRGPREGLQAAPDHDHQVMGETRPGGRERLSGHLSRELGSDALPVVVHRELDAGTRGVEGGVGGHTQGSDSRRDVGSGVLGGAQGEVSDPASRDQTRSRLDLWKEAMRQAWETLSERVSDAYDRVRAAIVDSFTEAVRAVRDGHEAARGAECALATAGAELGGAGAGCREHAPEVRRGLEHRADELARFKTQISLVDYAASRGYEVDRRESSRASVVMRGPGEDKIVVATDADGHGVYFSVRDQRDSGSIIDFVQRRQGLNLGQVRKELRPWASPSFSYHPSGIGRESYPKPEPSSRDRHRVSLELARMRPAGEHRYLKQRGLDRETLRDGRFAGAVWVDGRGNAVFPHQDRQGWCGAEVKNEGFTGFLSGGEKGLWMSDGIARAERLVIVESGIDAMSHAQLSDRRDTGYVSIGGSLSEHQRELLRGMLAKADKRWVEVVVGTDRDKAGRGLASEIAKLAPAGMRLRREEPPLGKDWNEELQQQAQQQLEISRGYGL